MKTGNINIKKIVAIVLVLFALLCMFLPWVKADYQKLWGGAYDYNYGLSVYGYASGSTAQAQVRQGMRELTDAYYYEFVYYYDTGTSYKWADAMADMMEGGSVIRIMNANSQFAKFAGQAQSSYDYLEFKQEVLTSGYYYPNETEIFNRFFGAVDAAGGRSAVLIILFVAALLTVLHALVWMLLDKKYFGWGAFAGIAALFVCVCIQIFGSGEQVAILLSTYDGWSYGDFYAVTAWPILGLVAMAGAVVLWLLYNKERQYVPAGQAEHMMADFGKNSAEFFKTLAGSVGDITKTDWTCPTCGVAVGKKYEFCIQCGTKRPEPRRCPYCQNLMEDGSQFCGRCGQQYKDPKVCTVCGTTLAPDATFCGGCGSRMD